MALNIENIVEELKGATILELNDLVKAIEEEFGVTAARNHYAFSSFVLCTLLQMPILK